MPLFQPEALALLKKSIFYTAPSTHRTIPRRKLGAQIRSAFNPHDRVMHPPEQSASEQQQSTRPMHGLQMWSGIVKYATCASRLPTLLISFQLLHEAEHDADRKAQTPCAYTRTAG